MDNVELVYNMLMTEKILQQSSKVEDVHKEEVSKKYEKLSSYWNDVKAWCEKNKLFVFISLIVLLTFLALSIIFANRFVISGEPSMIRDQVGVENSDSEGSTYDAIIVTEDTTLAPDLTEKDALTPTSIPVTTDTPDLSTTPTTIPKPIEPPVVNISYPSEGQYIEIQEGRTLCAVDIPVSSTSGLQSRHNFNNEGWTSYANHSTLCFTPNEGNNAFQVQYRNDSGTESGVIVRNFKFHWLSKLTYTISAKTYEDKNCSGGKEPGEEYITSAVRVVIIKLPELSLVTNYEDSDGDVIYSGQLDSDESIELELHLIGSSGYKINPNYDFPSHNFTSDSLNWGLVEIPSVPNANVGECS